MTMKKILAALALSLFLSSCPGLTEPITPAQQQQAVALAQLEEQARAAVAAAALTPDPADDMVAAAALKAVQEEFADLEAKILRDRAGPFVTFLTMLPVVGPWVGAGAPFLLGLAPLFGKRGRKHYKRLLANLIPGMTGSDGSKGVSPVAALGDLGRALGILHSSKASEEAAAKEA